MWTAPPDFTAGNILTAAQLDILSQNLLHLFATPQYRCSAFHGTTQTITSGNTSALSLNSEDFDTASMHDTSSNNSRIVIPNTGVYLLYGATHVENAAQAPAATITLRTGGATVLRSRTFTPDPGASLRFTFLDVWTHYPLSAGTYVELLGTATGDSVTFGSATYQFATRLEVIGPLPPL